jgi:urease accessory protein
MTMIHGRFRNGMTRAAVAAAALGLSAAPAFAHVGHDHVHGEGARFVAGILHPLTGADHLLAMVAVGIWAAMIGGRALYAFPAAFVSLMTLSALAGMGVLEEMGMFGFGGEIPLIEAGIALSVVAFGLAIALNLRAGLALGTTACALFATAHGYAHGAELPAGAGALGYIAGFVAATLALHAAGIALGVLIGRGSVRWVARGAGGVTAGVGVLLLVG